MCVIVFYPFPEKETREGMRNRKFPWSGLIQLKNMINALYSSQTGGTKNFYMGGTNFGWKAITDLSQRECTRQSMGQA